MPKQLIYSTVAEGIDGGRGNLCYAAASPGALQNEMLKSNLLQINSYQQLFTFKPNNDQNPINFCHYKFSIGNSEISVVSRIGAAQMYGGRSNFFAHHLLLDKNELPPYGPATLIRNGFKFKTEWDNQQNLETPVLPLNLTVSPGLAKAWQSIGQDPGWAGWVAEKAIEGRQIQVLYPQNLQPVHLLEDILAQVKEHQRWKITFSTYYTLGGNGPKCSVQFIPTNATNYCSNYFGKKPSENVLDLTNNLGLAPTSELSESARGQQKKQPENLIGTSKKAQNKSKTSEHGGQTYVAEEIPIPPNQEDPGSSRPPIPENRSLSGKFILACFAPVIIIFFAAVLLVGGNVWSHKNHFNNEMAKINQKLKEIEGIQSKLNGYTTQKQQLEKPKPAKDQKVSTEKIDMNKPKLIEAENFTDFERFIEEKKWDGINVKVETLKEIHKKLFPKAMESEVKLTQGDLKKIIDEGITFNDWFTKLQNSTNWKDLPTLYFSKKEIDEFISNQSAPTKKNQQESMREIRAKINNNKKNLKDILKDLEKYVTEITKANANSKRTLKLPDNYIPAMVNIVILLEGIDSENNQFINNLYVKCELLRHSTILLSFLKEDGFEINDNYIKSEKNPIELDIKKLTDHNKRPLKELGYSFCIMHTLFPDAMDKNKGIIQGITLEISKKKNVQDILTQITKDNFSKTFIMELKTYVIEKLKLLRSEAGLK